MTSADLITLAGASVVVGILVEIAKRALGWTAATVDRFGPLLAVVIGLVLVTSAGIAQGADPLQSALTGLLAGATSGGLYDLANASRRATPYR